MEDIRKLQQSRRALLANEDVQTNITFTKFVALFQPSPKYADRIKTRKTINLAVVYEVQ